MLYHVLHTYVLIYPTLNYMYDHVYVYQRLVFC